MGAMSGTAVYDSNKTEAVVLLGSDFAECENSLLNKHANALLITKHLHNLDLDIN